MSFGREPLIKVGLIAGEVLPRSVKVILAGRYRASDGTLVEDGEYEAWNEGGSVRLAGGISANPPRLSLTPLDFVSCRARVHGVTIGIGFHWERAESQDFRGVIVLSPVGDRLMVINELPLEDYLVSVISSEMSATSPQGLLRAHAIVSRSWLLAQMSSRYAQTSDQVHSEGTPYYGNSPSEIIRWYGRESHADFDVCADDHCQRYQGISKAISNEASEAVRDTRGKVLIWNGEICDARYSKCCGGMTEEFRAAWEDREVPYLRDVYDSEGESTGFPMPLTREANATFWIKSNPAAFCNTNSVELLERVLPGFDQETRDFFRWEVDYSNEELSAILRERADLDFGRLVSLEAIERGKSGRIVRLKITGEKQARVIGKELFIRRALSNSHLYSSAFVVESEIQPASRYPKRFKLSGAGWGHGVGLCQIGAASMADRGYAHEAILSHYFGSAGLTSLY